MTQRPSFPLSALFGAISGIACLGGGLAGVACGGPVQPDPVDDAVGKLVLNEVNCGKNPDEYIELVNAGDADIATAGFAVSDQDDDDAPFPVPPRTLAPGERVLVTGDLGLSCADEGAYLYRDGVVVDRAPVRTGDADTSTWGRFPDGTGPFQETTPTPQKPNRDFVDERDSIFDLDADFGPAVVDLFVDADVEENLRINSKQAGYVPALFMFTDATGSSPPQRVDIRIKGSITLRPWDGKPGLKIHFARHADEPGSKGPVEFRGLRKMTLNNLTYDPSYVREHLAYAVMRESGHAGPRVGWLQLFVNGEDKGLYSTIETYDRVFLDDHYDGTTVMYESDGATSVGSLGGFDVDEGPDTGTPEDFAPLQALASHIDSLPPGADNVTVQVPEVDWRQIARISALEDLLAHFDGHKGACHNFFLHQDESGLWTLLPWSVDLTLVTGAFDTSTPLGACGKLVQVCDQDPQCRSWFERDRDRAAQMVLHPELGDAGTSWRDRMLPVARTLQPFVDPAGEPFSGNEFFNGVGPDLEQNTEDAIDLLETRARHIRCATTIKRGGELPAGETPDCSGFALDPLGGGGR